MLNIVIRNNYTNFTINAFKKGQRYLNEFLYNQSKFYAGIKQRTTTKSTFTMERTWQPASMELPKTGQKQYRLLSYNILAQDLLIEHIELYVGVDERYLLWDERLRKLQNEIKQLRPDVLCLQEMQYNHMKQFVQKIKGHRKMEYVFKKKTGSRTDGCAIIYDRDKFKLIEERSIEYFEPGHSILNRINIALLAKFALRAEPDKQVVIATTHLLYNPRRDDVRDAQAEMLIKSLKAFSSTANTKNKQQQQQQQLQIPVILTGDFNCEYFSSTFARLTATLEEQQQFQYSGDAVAAGEILKANNPNGNAAGDANGQNGNNVNVVDQADYLVLSPLNFGQYNASTFQNQWIIVDHILYSVDKKRRKLKIWRIFQLPTIDNCHRYGVIPNNIVGSDHFPLAMIFSVL